MFALLLLLASGAHGGCADFSLFRGLFGLIVDTCPSKRGDCCGQPSITCVQGAYSAVCRCPTCPTPAPTLTLPPVPTSPGDTLAPPLTLPPSVCSNFSSCEACLDSSICAYCESTGQCVPLGYKCAMNLRILECPFVPPTAGAGGDGSGDVDGPQQIVVGNTTVNVTVIGEFDKPLGRGKSFMWNFDPAVAISWIELIDFDAGERARLTVKRTADGMTDTIIITDKRQDLIAKTESGFNMYYLEALDNAEFKINTLSIVLPTSTPKTEPPPPSPPQVPPPVVPMEPGSGSDGLVVGLIVAGVLFCLAAIALVFFIVRRRRRDVGDSGRAAQVEHMPVQGRESMYGNFNHAPRLSSSGDAPSQYGAAPATQSFYTEPPAPHIVYSDAPRDTPSYTDPRRSGMSMYEHADSPLN